MGLAYKTTRWLDRLWGEHLDLSESCRELVKTGISKQGDAFAGFPADLHARLYLPSEPEETGAAPDWAAQLHGLATETAEWNQLKLMTARNGFAAGIAAEILLEHLLPHVPDAPEGEPSAAPALTPSGDPGDGRSPLPGGEGQSGAPSDPQNARPRDGVGSRKPGGGPSPEQADSAADSSALRAALRKAAREARDAVQDAESAIEGMGPCMPGNEFVKKSGPANLAAIREAHERLKNSPRLKRIAQLAGRLERLASSKARSKVRPGVGEIHGVEIGDDLARLLPSELVCLRHPKLKLVLMSRILERRALTYGMTGREPTARGPIVILLDESASMREDGKDIWSKAVALALLSTATKQRRAWHLIAFNGGIRREVSIEPGKATPADIANALDQHVAGGTDFDAPVLRAVEIIRTSRTMRQADVVVITDGEDDMEPETIDAAVQLTRSEGVSWFVVGVGSFGAKNCVSSLGPIATSMVVVGRTDETDPVLPVINLEGRTL